jgi:hypothetical protein
VALTGEALLEETARRAARASFTAAQVRRVAAQTLDPAVPAARVFDQVDAAGRDALTHAVSLSPDGGQIPAGQRRYATQAQLNTELDIALLAEAGRLSRAGGVSDPARVAAEAPDAAGRLLDAEQAAAVRALTSPGRVRVLVAPAGAGKTFVLAQAVRAWQHDGRHVVLLAQQGKAADVAAAEISRAAGGPPVPALTLARAFDTDPDGLGSEHAQRWRAQLAETARMQGAVLVVDEAGVVDTAMLGRVLTWSAAHDVAVRLVGDPKQQQAIGAGGMLGYLARDGQRTVELGTVRRFTDPAEGPASIALRAGDPAALDFYAAQGRIRTVVSTGEAVQEAVVAAGHDRAVGHATLIVTATDAQRAAAADAVHQLVVAEHAAAGHPVDLRTYGRMELAAGEPIRARRNDYQLIDSTGGVLRNGSEWTVTELDADGITAVRHDDPTAQIRLSGDYVRDHVEHAYAITAYRAQGLTTGTTHIVGAEQMTRETLYVALSRARDGGRLYIAAEDRADALVQLRDALTRRGEQQAALDVLASHLDTRRDRTQRLTSADTPPAPAASLQPDRFGQPDRSEPGAAPPSAAADPQPLAVPHWRNRPAGDLTNLQLAADLGHAQARAQQEAAQAARRRAEADQLGAVLGTADSPARQALSRRWDQLHIAEAHLAVADQHTSLSEHARRQASAARSEAEEASRLQTQHSALGLRFRGTSRAELRDRAAAARQRSAAWWEEADQQDRLARNAFHQACSTARQITDRDPGYMQWQVANTLQRVRAELSEPATIRAADRADQRIHQDRLAGADEHARASGRWAAQAHTLTRETELRAALPNSQRRRETIERSTHLQAAHEAAHQEAVSYSRRPGRLHDWDLDHYREPDRGYGLER